MGYTYSALLCAAAIVAVRLACRAYGRVAGMLAVATCGVSVAWILPPAFSLQVGSFFDRFILLAYGAVSLLLVTRSSGRRARIEAETGVQNHRERNRTNLSLLVPALESVELSVAEMAVTACPETARRALRQVFDAATAQGHVEKISVYGGRWPGVDRIWVAARYRSLPEEPCVLMSGRSVQQGPMITSFDNGYERVYQISLPAEGQET